MNRLAWDKIAPVFETQIFDVKRNDKNRVVIQKIQKFCRPEKIVADFGCGIGSFVPELAESSASVIAIDYSKECIKRAIARNRQFPNVRYLAVDLASDNLDLPEVHVGLSVNVLISPNLRERTRILDLISRKICRGGHLILVVPSVESLFLRNAVLIEWNLKSGVPFSHAGRAGFPRPELDEGRRIKQGVFRIASEYTKCYTEDEIAMLLQLRRMKVTEIERVEYSWNTEFDVTPKWMRAAAPWDWLVVAERL